MINRLANLILVVIAVAVSSSTMGQEPGKNKDEALDSLLEKITEPNHKASSAGDELERSRKPKERPRAKAGEATAKSKSKSSAASEAGRKSKSGQIGKPGNQQKPGVSEVPPKDKELDELLEKLGESKDEPATEPERRRPALPGEKTDSTEPKPGGGDRSKPAAKDKAAGLEGKDKEIDERLEEFAGKKRKRNRSEQEEAGGSLGQIIKEMRDVEQRLGKPDTSEDTQGKQKQIVKKIETLIEQLRQSGASGMAMRRIQQSGNKPGKQPGQTPGANAAGAPPTKPAKPSDRHSLAGGKDTWGHLPPELRQEMENVFKEEGLKAKEDLIRRYYMSVAKRKLVRGE
jgi:hypothetical protein